MIISWLGHFGLYFQSSAVNTRRVLGPLWLDPFAKMKFLGWIIFGLAGSGLRHRCKEAWSPGCCWSVALMFWRLHEYSVGLSYSSWAGVAWSLLEFLFSSWSWIECFQWSELSLWFWARSDWVSFSLKPCKYINLSEVYMVHVPNNLLRESF